MREQEVNVTVDEIARNSLKTIPLGRHGEPAELATPTVFLYSEANSCNTGQTILVDDGMTKAF